MVAVQTFAGPDVGAEGGQISFAQMRQMRHSAAFLHIGFLTHAILRRNLYEGFSDDAAFSEKSFLLMPYIISVHVSKGAFHPNFFKDIGAMCGVKISGNDLSFSTKSVINSDSPEWDEDFTFELEEYEPKDIIVSLYKSTSGQTNPDEKDLIASAEIPLLGLEAEKDTEKIASLTNVQTKEPFGTINFICSAKKVEDTKEEAGDLESLLRQIGIQDKTDEVVPTTPVNDEAKIEEKPANTEGLHPNEEGNPAKIEEPPAKIIESPAKIEEPPAKIEELPVKIEEPPAKIEEPPAKIEEPPAKIEEPPAKIEEPPAKIEEPPAKIEEPPAKIEEQPAKIDEQPAKIESTATEDTTKLETPINANETSELEHQSKANAPKAPETPKEKPEIQKVAPLDEQEAPEARDEQKPKKEIWSEPKMDEISQASQPSSPSDPKIKRKSRLREAIIGFNGDPEQIEREAKERAEQSYLSMIEKSAQPLLQNEVIIEKLMRKQENGEASNE